MDTYDAVQRDTNLGYEKWLEKYNDELWIEYHKQGASHNAGYEKWCEDRYEKYVKDEIALLEKLERCYE